MLLRRALIILALATASAAAAAADQPQHAQTQGNQSPAIIGNASVSYGYTAEQLATIIAAAINKANADTEQARHELAELKQRLGVTEGAARTILAILGQQDVPFEQLPQKLGEITAQYKQTIERIKALDPTDPVTRDLIEKAQTGLPPGSGGMRSERHASARMAIPSMLARASTGVR